MPDILPTTFGNISLALEVVFLNSAVDATGLLALHAAGLARCMSAQLRRI